MGAKWKRYDQTKGRSNKLSMRIKDGKKVSWTSSQARIVQQERKSKTKRKFLNRTKRFYGKIEGHIFPTKKHEDTEECRKCRNLTQTETYGRWKELRKEIEKRSVGEIWSGRRKERTV